MYSNKNTKISPKNIVKIILYLYSMSEFIIL
jgi:hypothetical protein